MTRQPLSAFIRAARSGALKLLVDPPAALAEILVVVSALLVILTLSTVLSMLAAVGTFIGVRRLSERGAT